MGVEWRKSPTDPKRGCWCIRYTNAGGKRVRESTPFKLKGQKPLADALYAEVVAREDRRKRGLEPISLNPTKLTVKKAAEKWLEDNAGELKSLEKDRYSIHKHIINDAIGKLLLERVSRSTIEEWLDRKSREERVVGKGETARTVVGVKNQTLNNLRMFLQRIYSSLEAQELWLGRNPVRLVPQRDVEQRIPPYFSDPSHALRLLWALEEPWRTICACALYAGMRRSEVLRMQAHHVVFEDRVMQVTNTKGKCDRLVPLHPELVRLLRPHAPPNEGEGHFFPGRDGGQRHADAKASEWVREACQKAGIPEVTFHGLRHTWATHALQCGVSGEALEAMGWGSKQGTTRERRYTHLNVLWLRDQLDRLQYPQPKAPPGSTVVPIGLVHRRAPSRSGGA